MGQVALKIKIMPESPESDVEKIKSAVREKYEVKDMKEAAIGFGLKAVEVMLVFDDREGADTDAIEKELSSIDGVASVESGDITVL